MNPNALLILQLLLQYSTQLAELGALLRKAAAEGRDVTDAEVLASRRPRDSAIAEAQAIIDGAPST